MEKMGYFDGSSFLSFPDTGFTVPEDQSFKISFDAIMAAEFTVGVPVSFAAIDNAGITVTPPAVVLLFNPAITVPFAIADGVKHSFELGRLADGTYFYTVDEVPLTVAHSDPGGIPNFVFGTIGKVTAALEGAFGAAFPFTGYVGNVKIYINDVLKLDVPMTADFLDHSSNAYEITNTGVVLADVGGTTYSVTYDGNENTGGAVPTDENTYEESAEVTVLGNTGSLVKTGYTFAGWNTSADGSGTDYAPAATFAMGTANVTLYAQWEAAAEKIKLNKSSLEKPALVKSGLTAPCLIKSK